MNGFITAVKALDLAAEDFYVLTKLAFRDESLTEGSKSLLNLYKILPNLS
ncbi:MAG: hypothetical protein ACT4O9_15970 [Blastocatellia bacterium]